MKKRVLALLCAAALVLGTAAMGASGDKTVTVTPMTMTVNGQAVTPLKSDGTPADVFSYEGATYAPVRYLAELLGIQVNWDAEQANVAALVSDKLPAGSLADGTYTGAGVGFGGDVTAAVTVSGGKITAVKLTGESETPAIGGKALPTLEEQIVSANGAEIDGVAGATITSAAAKTAVAAALANPGSDAALVPGIYEGTAHGYAGDVTVHVTVDNSSILKVDVVSCTDVPANIQKAAIAVVPQAIVDNQSTKVDGVSGATFTSSAIKRAVVEALDKAGNSVKFAVDVKKTALTQGPDETVDILVLGGGGSGCMAALYAQNKDLTGEDTGLKVMMVEKQAFLGGSVMLSGGYIGAAMPLGNSDLLDSDYMGVYLDYSQMEGREEVDRPLLERVARVSNVGPLAMQQLGLPLVTAPSLKDPSEYGDLIGWSLLCHAFEDPTDDGWQQGGDEIGRWFERRLRQTNVDVRMNTTADELIVKDNAVVGAVVHDGEHTYNVYAKKIINACGSFISSPEMFAKYYPQAVGSPIYANGGNTGDGLRMVTEKFGVEPVIGRLMDGYFAVDFSHGEDNDLRYMFFDASHSIVVVNKAGRRIAYDGVGYSTHGMCNALYEQEGKVGYVIVDANHPGVEMLENSQHQDVIVKGSTLAEVAGKLGIDAAGLEKTAAAYNAVRKGSGQDEFGVPAGDMISLEKGPFYGVPMYAVQTATFSGFHADENCRILDNDRQPIANLYGCGETIYGEAGVAGALFTGAIAGMEAANAILGK